ncbi:hypothetical protein J2Y48_000505 [Mycoplana sp. BE70]|uniref:hypothetical protein n=1 Tax=Mycoplana sp. BE70 TaxID=2817775 RepID=UPI00285E1823|nr:hypothetical protein [Mycoplana sp. BE70]MDR6755232.1 hypothetical protein [Mycoplana sp. BE70]
MVFGPSRPPITEDVAEVITKDLMEGEGHTPTSETPIAFVKHPANPTTPDLNNRVRWVLFGTLAAMLVLIAMLILR